MLGRFSVRVGEITECKYFFNEGSICPGIRK